MIKVLVADDEFRICRLIIKLIDWEELGMEVVATASNGVEALELMKEKEPDILITDIRMPGYDGLEMIERAKKIKEDLEFIIISGYSHFEYAKKAIGFGVVDYLVKPINKNELQDALLRIKKDIVERRNYKGLKDEFKDLIRISPEAGSKSEILLDQDLNRNNIQIEEAKEYINKNYMNNISLEDLGELTGLNPSYFSSIFKKETGVSFIDYLSSIRIDKAKDLLKEVDLKIQDISIMVGYNDVKYFSRLFSKITGLKPRDYRKMFK